MRLVDSSDPGAVARYDIEVHYTQRLVLTAGVCQELRRSSDNLSALRPQNALSLLAQWMRASYELPKNRDVDYMHDLTNPLLRETVPQLEDELVAGSEVCAALAFSYTADHSWELEKDQRKVRGLLRGYLTEFDPHPGAVR